MRYIINIIISSFAVLLASYLLPGVITESFTTAILVALVLSLLNIFIKPLLVLFTLPITFYTLGLFLLVINALLIIFTSNIVDGFFVDGFWWALAFSLILSITNGLFQSLNSDNRTKNQ